MSDLASLGEGTAAVWTHQAATAALNASAVKRQRNVAWQAPLPGVLADAGYLLDPVQWGFAGVLASGGEGQPVPVGSPGPDGQITVQVRAAACGRDAARVWGYPLIDDEDPTVGALDRYEHDVHTWSLTDDLVAPVVLGNERAHTLHRHRLTLLAGDLVQHPSGLWITSPLRTALHCCTLLSFEAAVCVMDGALHDKRFTVEDLSAAIDLRAGHPGVKQMRQVADAADGRAESPNETLIRLILKPGWPELEPQVTIYDERTYPVRRYDLGDRTIRLGVEGDGKRNHAGAAMVAKDNRLDRSAARYGWKTERVTWVEARTKQDEVRRRVHEVRRQLLARAA